jgi:superfamily I DNA and/or RNA helicase
MNYFPLLSSQIKAKDIGIISPYRKQVVKIKELLNKKFPKNAHSW